MVRFYKCILIAVCCVFEIAQAQITSFGYYEWDPSGAINGYTANDGCFIGGDETVVITAGGINPNGLVSDEVAVFFGGPSARKSVTGKLSKPLAFGASVFTPEGIICIGGRSGDAISDQVFILKWNGESETIQTEDLPSLPVSLMNPVYPFQ